MKINVTTKMITRSAMILALSIAVQAVKLPQPVTGPLINTLLLMAVAMAGPLGAVLVGVCTPLFALLFGIMPFAPAAPVIMLGNASLAIVFARLIKKPVWGVIAAAFAKYGIMALMVFYLLPGLFQINIPAKLAAALTTPQLFTALGGGILALIILKAVQQFGKNKDMYPE